MTSKRAKKYCSVFGCLNNNSSNPDLSFFQLPTEREAIEQWLVACDRVDLFAKSVSSLRHTYVCGRHFERRMYGKSSLKKHAKPTLLLPPKDKSNATTQTEKLSLKRKINNETTLVAEIDGCAIISRVYHYLEKEYEQLKALTNNICDLSLLANTLRRTATATGVSEQLITEILEQELSKNDTCKTPAEKRMKVNCEDQPEAGSSKVNDIEELSYEEEDDHLKVEEGYDPLRSPSHEDSSDTTYDEVKIDIEEHPLELAEGLIESLSVLPEHQEPPVTTHVIVKIEPADDDIHPQVQLGTQTNPADYAFTPALHTEVKKELTDKDHPQTNPADYASTPALHTEVKTELTDKENPQTKPADYASTPALHTEVKKELTDKDNPQSGSTTHQVTPDPPPPAELKTMASRKNKNHALTAATKEQIVFMYGQKHSISEIGRRLQISRKSVKHWVARYRDSGDLGCLRPGPQPSVFTDASSKHREIVARHLSDPHASTRSTATALNITMQTVRNHLRAAGLRSLLSAKTDPSKQRQPHTSWQKVGDTQNHTANSNNITAPRRRQPIRKRI